MATTTHSAWLRWAAVLAFVGLGTGSGFLWWRQAHEIAGLRTAAETSDVVHRQAIAELEARRALLEAQYQERLRADGETGVKNPLVAVLEPRVPRRGPLWLTVGLEVSHLVLVLPVDDPAGTEFQIDVNDRNSGQQIFVQKGLRADVLGEVRLGLPAVLLPPADYSLRLFRKEGDNFHLVRQHEFGIKGTR